MILDGFLPTTWTQLKSWLPKIRLARVLSHYDLIADTKLIFQGLSKPIEGRKRPNFMLSIPHSTSTSLWSLLMRVTSMVVPYTIKKLSATGRSLSSSGRVVGGRSSKTLRHVGFGMRKTNSINKHSCMSTCLSSVPKLPSIDETIMHIPYGTIQLLSSLPVHRKIITFCIPWNIQISQFRLTRLGRSSFGRIDFLDSMLMNTSLVTRKLNSTFC